MIRCDLPLAGRREQLTEIESALQNRTAGAVLITGPMGVGKTRLAREIVVRADAEGCATHWVVATLTASEIPLGALAHLLPDDEDVSRTLLSRLQIADRVLRRGASGRAVVMGVDDIHLLDSASAALIHHLIVSGTAFVIATARSADHAPDVFTALWRQGAARSLELEPLTEDATAELLSGLLGDQVDGRAKHRFHQLSQGNALYLRELVQAASSTSALRKVTGVWRLHGSLFPTAALERLLWAGIEHLDPAVRRAVEVVALGEPLGVSLLSQICPAPPLETAEAAGLIHVLADGRRRNVELAHPLLGQVIRAAMPRLRWIAIHRRMAEVLAECGARRREDLRRLATWRLEGAWRTNSALLLTASREAAAFGDHRLAARLAHAAREAGAGFPATLLAAETHAWQGRTGLADELFAQADREAADPGQRAHVACSRGALLFLNSRRLNNAIQVLEQAAPQDRAGSAMRLVTQAFLEVQAGRTANGLRILLPLVADSPTELVRRHALPTLANALTTAGRTGEALRICRRVGQTLRSREGRWPHEGHPSYQEHWSHLEPNGYLADGLELATFNALMYHGLLRDAERLTTARYQRALESDNEQAYAAWAFARGRVALGQGRFCTAEHWLRESVHLLREYPTLMGPVGLLTCLGDLAMIATLHGNPDAAGLRDEADGVAQEDVFAPDYELAKAWVANLRGDTANALRRAWRTAERATALGGYADAARALHTMVRFGAHGQAFAPLANLARQLQGRVIAAFAAHAAAIDANDSAKLDQVAAAFASLGMMRLAAEAAGTAAALHRRSRRYSAAADAISSAVRYAQQCNGAPIRALLHDDAVATLSARERELTMLAVSGMTNREIAERLVLSVRTVENHMYRTYAKLGIASRNELSCFLWDDGSCGMTAHRLRPGLHQPDHDSASFDADERASSAIHPASQTTSGTQGSDPASQTATMTSILAGQLPMYPTGSLARSLTYCRLDAARRLLRSGRPVPASRAGVDRRSQVLADHWVRVFDHGQSAPNRSSDGNARALRAVSERAWPAAGRRNPGRGSRDALGCGDQSAGRAGLPPRGGQQPVQAQPGRLGPD